MWHALLLQICRSSTHEGGLEQQKKLEKKQVDSLADILVLKITLYICITLSFTCNFQDRIGIHNNTDVLLFFSFSVFVSFSLSSILCVYYFMQPLALILKYTCIIQYIISSGTHFFPSFQAPSFSHAQPFLLFSSSIILTRKPSIFRYLQHFHVLWGLVFDQLLF